MSRKLGSQCQAIKSPWADYAVYSFPDASRITFSDRQPLMDAMNGIIAINSKPGNGTITTLQFKITPNKG